ncbi:glycosyltransferase family 71 protein [[Candida] arabinofermentans NRRL YB-2248]|uniref:Glycosyltransferase family 71 protein n=1 Tax=[Candida] arabinofermentans NRRL YB-2248 TaxID=983967 RepID=A0A1E4SWS8_9ASCO|nr:glycosyltransferase family 71 protein [[Candida] arabinofermentans NRRL YB-2248]
MRSFQRSVRRLKYRFDRLDSRKRLFILASVIVTVVFLLIHADFNNSSNRFFESKQGLSYYEQEKLKNGKSSLLETKLETNSALKRLSNRLYSKFSDQSNQDLLDYDSDYDNHLLKEIREQENEDLENQRYKGKNRLINNMKQPSNEGPRFLKLKKSSEEIQRNVKMQKYFKKILQIIATNKPRLGFETTSSSKVKDQRNFPREYGQNGIVNIAVHDTGPYIPVLSEHFLSQCLKVPNELISELELSHKQVVMGLPDRYSDGLYSGNGIVFIGGGKYSWLSLLSLENLRAIGSVLPVEFIIPSEREYETNLCENVLPKLNAKCILLTDVLPDFKKNNMRIRGYQYKSLALLISSFENVLLLDSDNVPVSNPDLLFNSEPFQKFGMIVWPDFWRRVTHPSYYHIAGISLGPKRVRNGVDDVTPSIYYSQGKEDPYREFPLHDREGAIADPSNESGQIIVNKRTHIRALLLAFYYNFYGPQHYYPLFSQGGKGEGDKETFHAAAQVYGLPVYQVKKQVDVIGFWQYHPQEYYTGVGMIQYDPIVDYEQVGNYMAWFEDSIKKHIEYDSTWRGKLSKWWRNHNVYDDNTVFKSWFTKQNSKPMFIHSNFPKLDPVALRKENKLFQNGKRIRMYRDQTGLDFDFELRQWQFIQKHFCEDGGIELNYLKVAGVNSLDYCEFISQELNFLKSTTEVLMMSNNPQTTAAS